MKRISKICLFLMLFIIGIANASAINGANLSDAKEALKRYGKNITADRFCYYTYDGYEHDGYYGVILAIDKNNRYAGGSIETYDNHEKEQVINWTATSGCPTYAIVTKSSGWFGTGVFPEIELRVSEQYPTKYYEKGADIYKVSTNALQPADAKAHKMTCSYDLSSLDKNIKNGEFTLKFNNRNEVYYKTESVGNKYTKLSSEFTTSLAALDDTCPKLKMCYYSDLKNDADMDVFTVFFAITPTDKYKDYECGLFVCTNTSDPECDPTNSTTICPGFKFIQNNDNIAENEKDEHLVAFCTDVLSALDYSNPCAQKCMKYMEDNKQHIDIKNTHCGLTEKLFYWVMNILNWVKYLVPVLLIVLSILDFIKALAGEKEDEMKKAQKHFVTRLIAAALIFLTPFILEFIFDKMGFVFEGCGITK